MQLCADARSSFAPVLSWPPGHCGPLTCLLVSAGAGLDALLEFMAYQSPVPVFC